MKAYEFDWSGQYDPAKSRWHHETFSVGIFMWLPKRSMRGLKKSHVIKRITGRTCDPEPVYKRARNGEAVVVRVRR